jgi:DNA-repair protein XRCC4
MNDNSLRNESISTFNDENSKKYYLIQKWTDDDSAYLKLTLTDLSNFWSESFTKETIRNLSAEFQKLTKMDLSGIREQFYRAFTSDSSLSSTDNNYSIQLVESNNLTKTKSLTLKKLLDGGVKVEIINLKLKHVNEPAKRVEEMFDFCISRIKLLENQVSTLQDDNKSLNKGKKDAELLLQDLVKEKNNLEYDMYSKFALILNEKKSRIRELTADEQTQD